MNFIYKNTARLNDAAIIKTSTTLNTYRIYLKKIHTNNKYEQNESSINLPTDKTINKKINLITKTHLSKHLKCVVVIGIGGSNLGTKAIYDALRGPFDFIDNKKIKILFLDTISQKKISSIHGAIRKLKSKKEFLLISVSKSGGTTETIVNTEVLRKLIEKKFKDVSDRMIVISNKDSKFWKAAKAQNIQTIEIPEIVGGRYSVFSAVGLLPLTLVGIDTKKILTGAKKAVKDGISNNIKNNYSLISATLTYLHNKKGKTIHNTFLFAPELESLGMWYRQLMGESIGKEKDLKNKKVHTGITPIISIGSTDLHSMAQLYYGGPTDKYTNIVTTQYDQETKIPKNLYMPELIDHIAGKTTADIMSAVIGGVQASYSKNKLPYSTIELDEITEEKLGYYMQFRMIEMMYLAQLLNVNAFDQPAVESYKIETKKLLQIK